jgi:hypothetical protein
MARNYDITKQSDLRRMMRDLENDAKIAAKQSMRGAQHAARVLCPVHGRHTSVRETDQTGGFEITGCCDLAIQRAQAAAARRFQ